MHVRNARHLRRLHVKRVDLNSVLEERLIRGEVTVSFYHTDRFRTQRYLRIYTRQQRIVFLQTFCVFLYRSQ